MPTSWQKSSFPATTAAVVIICLAGLAMNALRPLVPKDPQSALRVNDEAYLKAGVIQPINWQNLSPEVFAEAKRTDRPIMMTIGHSGGKFAYELDNQILTNREVAAWLRANFICVRVDLSEFPAWRDIFFQHRRGTANTYPDLQVYFFSPAGQILKRRIWSRTDLILRAVPGAFTETIRDAVRANLAVKSGVPTQLDDDQTDGLEKLTLAPEGVVDFQKLLNAMGERETARRNDPSQLDLVAFPTWYLVFLFQIGQTGAATKLLSEYLASPMVDWLDGGFFHLATKNDLSEVLLEKTAIQTAEIMSMVTIAYKKTGNPIYLRVAHQAFDYLTGAMSQRGIIKSYSIYAADTGNRSKRSSFAPRALREAFKAPVGTGSEDLDWAYRNLGLQEKANPQMLIRVQDPKVVAEEFKTFERVLKTLRESRKDVLEEFGGERQLDTAGTACARLLRVARLLQDPDRIATAIAISDRLSVFRVGTADVVHSTRDGASNYRELKDYLAFADTMMEQYLLLGNVDALREGAVVMERAFELFQSGREGILSNWIPDENETWPPNLAMPGIVDAQGESTSAQAIRLALSYGSLLRFAKVETENPAFSDELLKHAAISPKILAEPMAELALSTASLHVAAYRVERTPVVIVKGPSSVEQATELNILFPTIPCIPLVGELTPNSVKLAAGYYTFFDGQLAGPVAKEDLLKQLGGR